MATPSLQVPVLDWGSPNIAESFKLFKQRLELYFTVKSIKEDEKVPIILLATGEEGLRRYNSWEMSEDDRKKPQKIFSAFLEQLEPATNHRVCRLELSKFQQKPSETTDTFINRCRLLAKKCEFTEDEVNERLVELLIASTPIPELQKELLNKPKGFKIEEAIKLARTHEASAMYVNQLHQLQGSTQIASINNGSHQRQGGKRNPRSTKCRNCGRDHQLGREHCPAKNDTCNKCGKAGHWATVCLSAKNNKKKQQGRSLSRGRNQPRHRLHETRKEVHSVNKHDTEIESDVDAAFENLTFSMIQTTDRETSKQESHRSEVFVDLKIKLPDHPGTHNFNLKVDTGAQANTLPARVFHKMFPSGGSLTPSPCILTAYNNTQIHCHGVTNIECKYKESQWINTQFYVVDVQGPAILGLPTSESLKVVTMNCAVSTHQQKPINSVTDLKNIYPDRFDCIGEFQKTHKLSVNPNVPCHIDPPRRTPIALREKIKNELDKMVSQQVIRKIEEPTDWVSSLTYVTKRDNTLRVCLDPRALNKALIRPYHQIPTVEELNHRFAGAKYFSKLDAKSGYWSIKLDEESQALTTFQTPFGRYCFQRLPFGLNVSQDIFQLEMDRILEKCNGACGIADDIVVHGLTEDEHDENLKRFMEVATQEGLTLNSSKCEIKRQEISFFGNIYTSNGMKPDPAKVQDLKQMSDPRDKTELQQFLGLMTYLSRFIKDFSSKTAVLRDLLHKDSEFLWEPHHQRAFEDLKCEISDKSLLHYFDPKRPIYMHCDASLQGIGAALLQPDATGNLVPVVYASKSLTPAEQRYACIERELLAIVFGTHRFHTYLYGHHFEVITDHKPLVMIIDKPLTSAPARLQRMLTQLQGYNFKLSYQKGTDNVLADGLSRLPSPINKDPIDLDVRVDTVRFSTDRIEQLKNCTVADPVLNQLRDTIITGWPETIKQLPTDIRVFWGLRDQLSVYDGLVLKGQQIVIPQTLHGEILRQLHTAHLGQEKTKLLAKDTVYWVNINRDIEQFTKACSICQQHQPSQTPEPLLQHDIPTKPWDVVGTDLFDLNGSQWLIIADYYSKYPVVKQLPTPSPSSVVVNITRQVFAEFGTPSKVVSDNGPHFSSAVYREFAQEWGFNHETTSPRRPQGNGFIERQVKTVKAILKKSKQSGITPEVALLHWRCTPVSNIIPSPAQLLMGRRIQSPLTTKIRNDRQDQDEIHDALQQRQYSQKKYFDRHARKEELPPLYPGQRVRVQNPVSGSWDPATIISQSDGFRSYLLKNVNGHVFRRNRQHIRDVQIMPTPSVPPSDKQKHVTFSKPLVHVPANPTRTTSSDCEQRTRSGRIVRPPPKMNL